LDAAEIAVGREYAAGPQTRSDPVASRARVRVTATGIPVTVGRGPLAQLQRDGVLVRVIEPAREGPLNRTLREYAIPRGDIAMPWARWCAERAGLGSGS
jgi:hypothetical protein